jgi:hypothetical protein
MRSFLLAFALIAASLIPSYAGVSAGTAAFLKEIGIDPRSPDVVSVAGDVVRNKGVQDITLNSLAAKRDEESVRRFIATRAWIHKYMVDTNAPQPSSSYYDTQYLTKAEKDFVFQQVEKCFPNC